MYTKGQASRLKEEFWTTFGKYIAPQLSAEGLKIKWINYKTGVKNVNFRMLANNKYAELRIELSHPDPDLRELFFEQFKELRLMLHTTMGEEWEWEYHHLTETARPISRIFTAIAPVNIFNKDDWPQLISFLKPRIIALDSFWSDARYVFESLK